jgi:hypothetical protein
VAALGEISIIWDFLLFQMGGTSRTIKKDLKIKGRVSPAFSPNLTMNLTYLCYGTTKIKGMFLLGKTFG